MSIDKNYRWEPKKKTAGDQVKEMAVYMVAMAAVYFVFYYIFLAISWPFRVMFRSPQQSFQMDLDQKKAKVTKRTLARQAYDSDESNPLYQYLERFKIHPSVYYQDPENVKYQEWFENMKSGRILDTDLVWAPEVYHTVQGEVNLNPEFLVYFARQVELHQSETLRIQVLFLNTVRDFYPEFTPEYPAIEKEIKDYQEEIKTFELHAELIKTIGEKGVSKGLAKELVEQCKDSQELKKAILVVQECAAKEFCDDMSLYCTRTGYDPNDEKAEYVNLIFNRMGNEELAGAVARGSINTDEVTEITKAAYEVGGNADQILNRINEFFKNAMRSKCHAELCGGMK